MGVKRYFILATVFVIAIFIFIKSLAIESKYTISILDYSLTLPVTYWIITPVVLLYVVTLFHIFYFGFKHFLFVSRIRSDKNQFLKHLQAKMYAARFEPKLKTEFFSVPVKVMKNLESFNVGPRIVDTEHEVMNRSLVILRKIHNGEVVDIKGIKLGYENPIKRLEFHNRLKSDKMFARNILSLADDLGDDLTNEAYKTYASFARLQDIKQFDKYLTKEIFIIIIQRLNEVENGLKLTDEEIITLLSKLDLNAREYVNMARELKLKVAPDSLINIFERVMERDEVATKTYLYVLFDFQMFDRIRDFFNTSKDPEYKKFKYMLYLKDQGKHFNIDIFMDC